MSKSQYGTQTNIFENRVTIERPYPYDCSDIWEWCRQFIGLHWQSRAAGVKTWAMQVVPMFVNKSGEITPTLRITVQFRNSEDIALFMLRWA